MGSVAGILSGGAKTVVGQPFDIIKVRSKPKFHSVFLPRRSQIRLGPSRLRLPGNPAERVWPSGDCVYVSANTSTVHDLMWRYLQCRCLRQERMSTRWIAFAELLDARVHEPSTKAVYRSFLAGVHPTPSCLARYIITGWRGLGCTLREEDTTPH